MTVLIAGGGIAGLALGLTLHQIGVPFRVFEQVRALKPLGVGINLQPSAVRELEDLGLADRLAAIGVPTRDYGMYTKQGLHVWTEPRGRFAGYKWPQYSVHRGKLHMMLYAALLERAGPEAVETGWKAVGFDDRESGAILRLVGQQGQSREVAGTLIIGADGIHSAIRGLMAPAEGPPIWGGAVMWRGTTRAKPFKTGASMVMIGHDGLRIVSYPISQADPETGLAEVNWIAMLNYDPEDHWNKEDWNRQANLADFAPRFEGMVFDWLNVPEMLRGAKQVYEYPMVDRDPLESWTEGHVTLMGDAAHAAYPVGSNGAGSAIIDARVMGRAFLDHGVGPAALQDYETQMRPVTSKVVLMNRVAGPDQILDVVEERCGGSFERLEDVISQEELAQHAARYKAVAGTSVEAINAAARTIPVGAQVG